MIVLTANPQVRERRAAVGRRRRLLLDDLRSVHDAQGFASPSFSTSDFLSACDACPSPTYSDAHCPPSTACRDYGEVSEPRLLSVKRHLIEVCRADVAVREVPLRPRQRHGQLFGKVASSDDSLSPKKTPNLYLTSEFTVDEGKKETITRPGVRQLRRRPVQLPLRARLRLQRQLLQSVDEGRNERRAVRVDLHVRVHCESGSVGISGIIIRILNFD